MSTLEQVLADYLGGTGVPAFGAVAGVWREGELIDSAAHGYACAYRLVDSEPQLLTERDRSPISTATRFDIASLTKLFTATLAMVLVDEGALLLDSAVADHLPEFASAARAHVTLRHLLSHTAGLPEDCELWKVPAEERVASVLAMPVEETAFHYSCLGYVIAGVLMERVTGTPLRELMRTRLLDPLGLAGTGFGPVEPASTAATEYQPWTGRGIIRGEVHDEVAWALGGAAGNAGLFSNLADLGRFGELIRGGGVVEGHRILSQRAVEEMLRPQLPSGEAPGFAQGIGFRIDAPEFMGQLSGPSTVGHTGFTGTSLVIDRDRALTVVLLTNRVHPTREGTDVSALRRAVAGAAASAT